jgi:hypothetical protein
MLTYRHGANVYEQVGEFLENRCILCDTSSVTYAVI